MSKKKDKIKEKCKECGIDLHHNCKYGYCGPHYNISKERKVLRRENSKIRYINKTEEELKIAVARTKAFNDAKHTPEHLEELNRIRAMSSEERTSIYKAKRAAYNKEYERQRKLNDVEFRIAKNIRSRVSKALRLNIKRGSSIDDLGCSVAFLKEHLESRFIEGMSWDNYGHKGWHIDHIIPLISFNLSNPEEFKKACHYTNLQPLWAIDNLKKHSKIIKEKDEQE
jgi:hypothetical protein